jgi:hypothetical protein
MMHYKGVLAAVNGARKDIIRLKHDHIEVKCLAPALDEAIEEMARKNRLDLLELGVPGRVTMQGKLEVLPLDDEALLDAACPLRPDGRIVIDQVKLEARHEAQARAALKSGPCALLVLGGGHDLSGAVRRFGGGTTQYVRLTLRRYEEVGGITSSSASAPPAASTVIAGPCQVPAVTLHIRELLARCFLSPPPSGLSHATKLGPRASGAKSVARDRTWHVADCPAGVRHFQVCRAHAPKPPAVFRLE